MDWLPTRSLRAPRVACALTVDLLLALGLLSVVAFRPAAAATIRCAYDGDAIVAAAGEDSGGTAEELHYVCGNAPARAITTFFRGPTPC